MSEVNSMVGKEEGTDRSSLEFPAACGDDALVSALLWVTVSAGGVGLVGWLVNSSHPPKPLSPPLAPGQEGKAS